MKNEQLRQEREEVARSRVGTHKLRVLAKARARKSDE